MMELGLELRALLINDCSVAMEPDVSLMVTTPESPAGFSMNVVLGTVYSIRMAPCPPNAASAVKTANARKTPGRKIFLKRS